jgi:hypothetical protein
MNNVFVPVTTAVPVVVVIVPVFTTLTEFATAVILPSKLPSHAVLDTVVIDKVGTELLSNTVNGTADVLQPEPVIPGVAGFADATRVPRT